LLALAALIIAFHFGAMHGECKAKDTFMKMMHMRAMRGGHSTNVPQAMRMPKDVLFYKANAEMMPGMRVIGPESGAVRFRAISPEQTAAAGMKVMKLEKDPSTGLRAGGQQFFLYKN
jgi:hypothetical protein